uniref:HID1 domain containing b n=1 Tax=Hucho hucho TaxID=62062 RepID=A0A4W5KG01_9TELE
MLTRILPYIFEDQDWRGFFWSTVPGAGRTGTDEMDDDEGARPLAESLLLAMADLLFCPDFTVNSHRRGPVSTNRIPCLFILTFILAGSPIETKVSFAREPCSLT